MKYKNIVGFLFLSLAIVCSGCYEEVNPNDDNFQTIGNVPLISDLLPSTTAPTAGSTIEMTARMSFVDTEVKELNLFQRIGTTGAYSLLRTIPFVPNFDQAQRVHVIKFPYDVPNEPGKAFSLQLEAVTAEGLISFRRTMSPTNVTIR